MFRIVVFLSFAFWDVTFSSVLKFENCCKNPDTISRILYEDVYDNSPYYVVAIPRTLKAEHIDNICYTYIENDNGDLLNAVSVVYKNGASDQYFHSVSDYSEKDGVSITRGPDCTYLDYSLERLCSNDVLLLYRCFVGVDSCLDWETDVSCIPGVDVRLALSKCPVGNLPVTCIDCIRTKLFCSDSFCGNDYILLPNLLSPQCVTEYNCRDAINAECAKGEICVKDCCRLIPHINSVPPPAILPVPPPAILPVPPPAILPVPPPAILPVPPPAILPIPPPAILPVPPPAILPVPPPAILPVPPPAILPTPLLPPPVVHHPRGISNPLQYFFGG